MKKFLAPTDTRIKFLYHGRLNMERTDVIVDYQGEQFIIELKIWHGNAYQERGEQQLIEYLNHYHLKKGYLLSYCFNKTKQIGIQRIVLGDKVLIEAVV